MQIASKGLNEGVDKCRLHKASQGRVPYSSKNTHCEAPSVLKDNNTQRSSHIVRSVRTLCTGFAHVHTAGGVPGQNPRCNGYVSECQFGVEGRMADGQVSFEP